MFVVTLGQVNASIFWCKADPTVLIDGNRVDINVYSTSENLEEVTGPTDVLISVPPGVSTELVSRDTDFRRGWEISFEQDEELRVT